MIQVFKLKQASAVVGVASKDLQNLVQFGVLKPRRRRGVYWFDRDLMVRAKVAFFLRESLGAATPFLAEFTEALFPNGVTRQSKTVRLMTRPAGGGLGVEMRVPVGALAAEVDRAMPLAAANADARRGRKRKGWKEEMQRALAEAGKDLGSVEAGTVERAADAVRRKRKVPEVEIVGPEEKTPAARRR